MFYVVFCTNTLNFQAGDCRRFIRIFQASPDDVTANILARERRELQRAWKEEGQEPEGCFIQEALQLLASREEKGRMKALLMLPGEEEQKQDEQQMPEIEQIDLGGGEKVKMKDPFEEVVREECMNTEVKNNQDQEKPEDDKINHLEVNQGDLQDDEALKLKSEGMTRARFSSGESGRTDSIGSSSGEEGGEEVTVEDLDISSVGEKGKRQEVFYFYQAADGQAIFMHALNIQMLVTEFGSLEQCPKVLKASILEKESCSMTEELRDRLRYLRHLPLAQSFEVSRGVYLSGISYF